MKAENLKILKQHGFLVPAFTVTDSEKNVDLSFSGSAVFAVRSSFSLEDSDAQSFAGQFETLLNVPRSKVGAAVKRVLESAGRVPQQGHMRVVVQEMVEADCSGVLFTANPLGLLNEMVVVVGKGLGENIVTDRIQTTTYYYHPDDGLYCFERQDDAAQLSEGQLKKLVEIGEKIRALFGREMDVEYAVRDDAIYVLQARPITTLKPRELIVLDNSNIAESYPGISLPLTQSFVREIYYEIFKSLVLRLSGDEALVRQMDAYLKEMVDVCNGRIYYRISSWYDVLRLLPFSKRIIAVWQEMLGVSHKDVTFHGNRVPARVKFQIVGSFFRYLLTAPKEMRALNARFKDRYPVYIRQVRDEERIDALLRLYAQMRDEVLRDWDITLVNDMYAFIFTHLAGKKHEEELADIRNLESMKPVLALGQLAETAKAAGMDSAPYKAQKKAYIRVYGDRCMQELKLETKTWRTNPELLDSYIAGMTREHQGGARAPKGSASRRASFLVRRAKTGIANRELSRMNRSRLFGIVRTIMRKIGKILAAQGRLEAADDVFYLFMEELKQTEMDYKALVRARKREYAVYEQLPAYSRLVFADHVFNQTAGSVCGRLSDDPETLCGTPCSAGKVRGRVLVLDAPEPNADTAGKIIVAKTTDPGWVFLIRPALGIIAEKGSVLSHTAIITRELKKPCVVNVKDAAKILKTGDLVELDAINGRVCIIERNGLSLRK